MADPQPPPSDLQVQATAQSAPPTTASAPTTEKPELSNPPDPDNSPSTSAIPTDNAANSNTNIEMNNSNNTNANPNNTSTTTRPDVTMSGTSEATTASTMAASYQSMTTSATTMTTMTAPAAAAAAATGPGTSTTAPTGIIAPGIPIDAGVNPVAAVPVLPPSKKDTSLREFLGQMDEYAPIIPDAVTAHYLTLAGLPPPGNGPNHTPPHLARLLALATQKFVADIAADAYQYSRIRSSNTSSNNPMGAINLSTGLAHGLAAAGGAAGGTAGVGASGGTATAGGGGGGGGEGAKGKGSGSTGLLLGVQRPGFGGGGQGGQQGRTVLTMEDLGMAVAEYGVSVKRGEFYR
ncbi:predicted protein [Histoplasma capsulatum G186AR]|uniref:Transcription initiation factor TFIID subunit 10 n=1 Tax=Ajellomyces capsulatus (strain G186AR / H82 / ATCC MYA-2454 / RMSCC 2432) TaxID=447093 RepID=C0NNV3_AJECG|nr:uncharacterized protein HCBG_04833 [Histoplasma capsulatum G186AR]EEH06613.1 predicted protein [Histoplasma capsulatum G186AR]